MELSKKTTILLTPRLYRMLRQESAVRNMSIGELIRSACEIQYGLPDESAALEAVDRISAFSLPVDSPSAMKQESSPEPEELIP